MTLLTKRLVGFGGLVLAVVVVLVAVGLLEHHTTTHQQQVDEDERLLVFERDKVAKVSLKNSNGAFALVRAKGGWWMSEPLDTSADSSVVDGIVSAMADLRRTRIIDVDGHAPDAADLSIFGLQPPLTSLEIEAGTERFMIDFGKKNDFNGELYASVRGSKQVVMVLGAIDYQIAKTVYDLRDKRLVPFDAESLSAVEVTRSNGTTYAIERRGGQRFFVTADSVSAEADAAQVKGVLDALVGLRAIAFATDRAASFDERNTFLTRLVLRAKLTAGDVSHSITLAKQESGWYAALDGEDGPIIQVAGEVAQRKADVDPRSLRDLRVVAFERADVGSLTLTRGVESVSFKADGHGGWVVSAATPSDGGAFPREADGAAVSGVIYTLFNLRADEVVSEEGGEFPEPVFSAVVGRNGGGEIASLLTALDAQKRTIARDAHKPRISAIPAASVSEISTKLTDYLPGDQSASK